MTELITIEPVAPHLLRSLREHVHERLRRAIVAGRFRNGERLNERHLAEMLGVSTTPVKDAIRKLESEGLVRTEARRGVFVEFSARQALEMALGRAALESVMAHIAANRLSDADIAAMAQLIDDMEHATDHSALEDLVLLNEAYHGAIHRISGCTYLERRLDGQRMYDHAQRIALLAEPAERRQGFEEHRSIYQALAGRDPALAEQRMRRHIVRSAKAHVRQVFGADAEGLAYDE
ncbi:GntR family transcriptional regulator [Bosea lathyri]|jgi:DNA-binding GntR family transcriptional regulator|uniref:Transcriptional regulator, GntR family n=1 Tax=Bosea lathyri TaxID=1036778 RepID=A0A1H6BJD7_9HYPH|nr:GntR family transcriptional regulator [Bosea lathyri]SEG60467.1 transcriptional regulator, GntR family [Bosea lathyri]